MIKWLAIGCGGFLGAIARYSVAGLVQRMSGMGHHAGTFVVNAIGCLAIGVFMSLIEHRQLFSPNTRLFLVVGLLGSFTTFSTFGHETFQFLRSGDTRMALLYTAGSLFVGVAAVAAGWMLAKQLVA